VDLGDPGVTIVFAISGLLISGLLFEEHRKTGMVNLSHFYMRRTFRIFPAYNVFIGVIALTAGSGWIRPLPGDLPAALTYTRTIMSRGPDTWAMSGRQQRRSHSTCSGRW
jgi:peptidoglycan/LPS O-acetylase OafA/YrhL